MSNHLDVDKLATKQGDYGKGKAADEEESNQPQLLGSVLDPVGKGLGTVLRPVGATVETITKPISDGIGGSTRPILGPLTGEKHERIEPLGGDNKDSYEHTPEKIAGKLQTGENPLGLDNTGRWGFRE